jgi:hypothetical protein
MVQKSENFWLGFWTGNGTTLLFAIALLLLGMYRGFETLSIIVEKWLVMGHFLSPYVAMIT